MDRAKMERRANGEKISAPTPVSTKKKSPAVLASAFKGNQLRSESLRAVILADDTTVRWSDQDIPDDQGCVRSALPVPRDVPFFIFEVEILNGEDLVVGLAVFDADGKRSSDFGYSYFGKNGQVKALPNQVQKCIPFKTGDVVTGGISFLANSIEPFVFFALNGEIIKPFLSWKGSRWVEYFPFVTSPSPSSRVRFSLDQSSLKTRWEPILKRIELQRERKRLASVRGDYDPICKRMVRDFLLHQGYIETLRAIDAESKFQDEPPKAKNGEEDNMEIERDEVIEDAEIVHARERRNIRNLVLQSRSSEAMKIVGERWPGVLATSIGLDLRIQCFVEMLQRGMHIDAIHFSRNELWPYLNQHDKEDSNIASENQTSLQAQRVKSALGLIAFPDLTTERARKRIDTLGKKRTLADVLHRAILFHPHPPKSPALENILVKLAEWSAQAKEKAGGYGGEYKLFPAGRTL